jgi:hypothetical protein
MMMRFVVEGVFQKSGVVHSFKMVDPVLFIQGCSSLLMSTLFSLGGLPAHPKNLEDQFASLSLASLLRPVQLGRPYQEHNVPAGITRKVTEACKPPPR